MDELAVPWQEVVDLADQTALGFRGTVGLIGAVLALAGARLYRFTILAPGILLGLVLATFIPETLDLPLRAGAAVLLAGLGAFACHSIEQMAVRTFGALLMGGLVWTGWPLFMGEPGPWWAPAAAAGIGLLLFPKLFKTLLKPLTAILGGVLVSHAVGMPGNPLVIGGVAALGMMVQFSLFSRSRDRDRDDER